MLSRWVTSLLLVQVQLPFPQVDMRRDVTESETTAYFLGPVKAISSGTVSRVEWSPDDQVLAIQSADAKGLALSFWNRKTERLQKSMALKSTVNVTFQPSAKVAWVNSTSERTPLPIYRIAYETGQTVPIFDPKGEETEIIPAPEGDLAFLVMKGDIALYSSRGVREIAIPSTVKQVVPDFEGATPILEFYGDRMSEQGRFQLDPSSLALSPAKAWAPRPGNANRLAVQPKVVRVNETSITSHWLNYGYRFPGDDRPRPTESVATPRSSGSKPASTPVLGLTALVASGMKAAMLAPKETMVAFWDRHNLFVREIKSMPESDFVKLYSEWEEKTLTENAKQVGIAIQLYSGDADDLYPQGTGSLDMLFPYAKDPGIFDNFQYSMNGQNSKDIKDPASAALGRINGRSGRAIVYADGHVVWERRNRT